MSLFGTMKTGVSGMNAQANRLGTVGDNIANSGTVGYKRASTNFSSMVLPSSKGNYSSGGVSSNIRYSIAEQGGLSYTTTNTHLAIQGAGFFVVEGSVGTSYLTRAGAFTKDDDGYLVNSAGYKLLGYPYEGDGGQGGASGFNGLSPVKLDGGTLITTPSTKGVINVNLPVDAVAVGTAIANLPPSQNTPNSGFNFHTVNVDETGRSDIYFTKLADNAWEITAYVQYTGPSTGFPYDLASGNVVMGTTTLKFEPATGAILDGNPRIYPDPADPYFLDFSNLSQQSPTSGSGSPEAMQVKINMPSDADPIDLIAGELPASANVTGADYLSRQTISGYAGFASNVFLDIYYTKTSTDTWEVAVYDRAKATAGGFPYGKPGDPPLAQQLLTFDPTAGALVGGGLMNVSLPGGDVWPIDFGGSVSIPDMSSGWEDGLQVAFNLPTTAAIVEPYVLGATPADNLPSSSYSEKASVITYDYSGRAVPLDIYYTKGAENYWEVTVFNQSDASNGGFPYSSAPLATTVLEFDPVTSGLVEPKQLEIAIPNGELVILDLSGSKSFASPFSVITAGVNGSSPSFAEDFVISDDGLVSVRYSNDTLLPVYQIALANVPSPDKLVPIGGNAFVLSNTTGGVTISSPNTGSMGSIVSGAVESSNVDIATELTEMVESQRVYSANSKVFQTGSELLDVLVNLKR